LANAHLATLHGEAGRVAGRATPREPRHLPRGAGSDPQPFAGVVADAGIAEAEHAIALAQRSSPSPMATSTAPRLARRGEEPVNDTRRLRTHRLVSLARQRPLEHGRHFRERVQVRVDRNGKMGECFAHPF